MLKNYLKVILSQLIKYKLQSLINILGMAIGLTCCLLISAYILFETSYDSYHAKADRIYRVSGIFNAVNSGRRAENSPQAGAMLQENFPQQIETYARIYGNTPGLFTRDEFSAFEDGFRFADNALFSIFDFEWIQGDPLTALSEPNTLVLTESLAEKYFPGEDPMGQVIGLAAQEYPMTVVGVIQDLPDNTHLSITALASMDLGVTRSGRPRENVLENWAFPIFYTFILLEEGADITELESEFPALIERYVPVANPNPIGMTAINVQDIHLFSTMVREYKPTGNVRTLITLGVIAVSVLLIACINFMNLSTARSSQRAREIGMRKVMGAERWKLVLQFIGESVLMTALAMCVALALVELVLPFFNSFLGKDITLSSLGGFRLLLALIAFVVFIGIGAGSYPAFFLSAFQPAKVLKGDVSRGKAGILFRNILVLAQFSISIILIVATSVVFLQIQFARDTDLGFNTERVLVVEGTLGNGLGPQWRVMEEQLKQHPGIVNVSATGPSVPLQPINFSRNIQAEGLSEEVQLYTLTAGMNFVETYGMALLAGREFSADHMEDQYKAPTAENPVTQVGYMINEAALLALGWTAEEAIGKVLRFRTPFYGESAGVEGTVIGVVSDAMLESVRDPVKPIYYQLPQDYGFNSSPGYTTLSIRLSGGNVTETLAYIDSIWENFNPDFDMRRRFLNDDFAAVYEAENQQGDLFMAFAGLAILLACFGLFGLAEFNAERRTKEIGIRKVMGSSIWQIVLLLTNDFSKLVLMANVIAWPVAYFAMNRWLENFAYRIDLTLLVFIGSGLIALCIAWVTVGSTAAKAASQKPVLALRYE